MLVLDDHTLHAAGLSYQEAVALLAPADHETVVHVRRERGDPAPSLPQPAAPDAISSLVIADDAADSDSAVYALAQQIAGSPTEMLNRPMPHAQARHHRGLAQPGDRRLPVLDQVGSVSHQPAEGAAALRHQEQDPRPLAPDHQRLGVPRLPDRGVNLNDLTRVAHALGAVVIADRTGPVQLVGKFGAGLYETLDEAAQALNARSFST